MKYFIDKKSLFQLMTYTVKSEKNIEDIIDKIDALCTEHNLALLHQYIYHEVVKEKGFPIERKVYIYEVCQAKVAALVLTDEPDFAPFMPCRIAVYEKEDHNVISTQNMGMMLDTLKQNKELYLQTNTLFETLKSLMNRLK
jgi:uncharacterized protein (DUF302 family)